MIESETLKIVKRYNNHSALISLGSSYSIPSKVTPRHIRELLEGYGDDEILNLSQLEVSEGPRPVLLWPVINHTEEPLKKLLCENEVTA